jgi:hypothetical protein
VAHPKVIPGPLRPSTPWTIPLLGLLFVAALVRPADAEPAPVASPTPPLAARPVSTPAEVTPVAMPPIPPLPEASRWLLWPLAVRADDAVLGRGELAKLRTALARNRHADACREGTAFLATRMQEAAHLFYAPVRKDANLSAISTYLQRWVRGKAPVLVLAGEVFAPAPGLRDAIATSCAKAGRWDDAEAPLRAAGMLDGASRVRQAILWLRWLRGGDLRSALWLVRDDPGVVAGLLRAFVGPADVRERLFGRARREADTQTLRRSIDALAAHADAYAKELR